MFVFFLKTTSFENSGHQQNLKVWSGIFENVVTGPLFIEKKLDRLYSTVLEKTIESSQKINLFYRRIG